MSVSNSYEVFEEIGRGRHTAVYRGYDLTLDREVAIKELSRDEQNDTGRLQAFLREAKFLAQFEHDNVLRIYSVDPQRGWIVMERMRGTLATLIEEGPTSPDLVRSILRQMLEAVSFLHENGKVHAAIRPTNILINDQGRVKLSDFEQKAVDGELRVPTGSNKHMAPELLRPELGEFGPAIDLYCLAFTALELLCGSKFAKHFPGVKGAIDPELAWLRWHSSEENLPPVSKLVPSLPADLANVLDTMLAKQANERPSSAEEVLRALDDKPLLAVDVDEHDADPEAAGQKRERTVVRTLAQGAAGDVRRKLPATATKAAQSTSAKSAAKSTATKKRKPKKTAARLSKDWWNQQLGRPLVLYPLCALMLVGFGVAALALHDPGETPTPVATIPVKLDIKPSSEGAVVEVDGEHMQPSDQGMYHLTPGEHAVLVHKPDYESAGRPIEVARDRTEFTFELTPVVRFVEVHLDITPTDAIVSLNGEKRDTHDGQTVVSIADTDSLEVSAQSNRFESLTASYDPKQLAAQDYKLTIELQKLGPELPEALIAKPGSPLDGATGLPIRAFAAQLNDVAPMEVVLVRAGKYRWGSPTADQRSGERKLQTITIHRPYYVAIHETSNDQYAAFASDRNVDNAWLGAAERWGGSADLNSYSDLPVTAVAAADAERFAVWVGGQLPTEKQWSAAARGEKDRGSPYPWGRGKLTASRCRTFRGELAPVAVDALDAGATPSGIYNLLGNAAELCKADRQAGSYVVKGGSFATANRDAIRVSWRGAANPAGDQDVGFRCVFEVASVDKRL